MGSIIAYVVKNWRLLLILFGLGGTVTVVGVVPGLDGINEPIKSTLESIKGKLVDPAVTVE